MSVTMISPKCTLVDVESYFVIYLLLRGWDICPTLKPIGA